MIAGASENVGFEVELAGIKREGVTGLRGVTGEALGTAGYAPWLDGGDGIDGDIEVKVIAILRDEVGVGAGGVPAVTGTVATGSGFDQNPGFDW